MDRVSDEALDILEYIAIAAMGFFGFAVTISPPREHGTIWWLSLIGFAVCCSIGLIAHRELHRRAESDEASLKLQLSDSARQLNEIRKFQRGDRQLLVNIETRLTNFAAPPPPPVSERPDSWKLSEQWVETRKEKGVADVPLSRRVDLTEPVFSTEAAAFLMQELSRVRGNVRFTAHEGYQHSVEMMRALVDVFSRSGWKIRGVTQAKFPAMVVGAYILAHSADSAFAGFVQGVLLSVGIKTKAAIMPYVPEDEIEILFGETDW